jgi:hypothetical protein
MTIACWRPGGGADAENNAKEAIMKAVVVYELVVGGPTHMHSLASTRSRQMAVEKAPWFIGVPAGAAS